MLVTSLKVKQFVVKSPKFSSLKLWLCKKNIKDILMSAQTCKIQLSVKPWMMFLFIFLQWNVSKLQRGLILNSIFHKPHCVREFCVHQTTYCPSTLFSIDFLWAFPKLWKGVANWKSWQKLKNTRCISALCIDTFNKCKYNKKTRWKSEAWTHPHTLHTLEHYTGTQAYCASEPYLAQESWLLRNRRTNMRRTNTSWAARTILTFKEAVMDPLILLAGVTLCCDL